MFEKGDKNAIMFCYLFHDASSSNPALRFVIALYGVQSFNTELPLMPLHWQYTAHNLDS